MAQYKVPQDVEADDKLLGPFSFRQFIYLIIVAALGFLAWVFFGIFPLLAVFPVLPALFFLVLALPLRKDQPMETYIAALISFYTKPNRRFWNPGQRESTITITAPKVVEKSLTRDLTGEEASHRLSFLANLIDSEGTSIKGEIVATPTTSPVRDEYLAEAKAASDIFENYESTKIDTAVASEDYRHHTEVVEEMRSAIQANETPTPVVHGLKPSTTPVFNPATLATPTPPAPSVVVEPEPALVELSQNKDFTVATIASEAKRRIKKSSDGEVYISLH